MRQVAILTDSNYLQIYGLRALILEMFPTTYVSLLANKPAADEKTYATIFCFKEKSDLIYTQIPENADEFTLRQLISQKLSGETKDTPSAPKASHSILTRRETDVLRLITKGYINKEVASSLNISLQTVISHRKHISAKLGIKTLSGLTVYAMMNGIK